MNKFVSPTYGVLDMEGIVHKMAELKKAKPHADTFNVIVGTDSQNFSDTKMVSVITMHCKGHGGIYFYRVEHIDKIREVRAKLIQETQYSLQYADALLSAMAEHEPDLFEEIHFSIHVDAGKSDKGKTKELIPSIVGWIHASGYECQIKPDSYAASAIANKISK